MYTYIFRYNYGVEVLIDSILDSDIGVLIKQQIKEYHKQKVLIIHTIKLMFEIRIYNYLYDSVCNSVSCSL